MDTIARLLERVLATPPRERSYAHHLAVEEALRAPATGLRAARVAEWIGPPLPTGPFNALDFRMYLETRDTAWLRAFESSAGAVLANPARSPEGAWLHCCGNLQPGRRAILLDSFQEEASRLIKLAWLIRRGEPVEVAGDPDALEEAACRQFEIHRQILRNPATGLWHNGRGWIADEPRRLSPGAWSRGHGWLMRGLMECLDYLGHPGRRQRLFAIFEELTHALMARLPATGLWQALADAAPGQSPPESSGTALIDSALIRASRSGLAVIVMDSVRVLQSADILLCDHLTPDGIVLSACMGPGPLVSDAPYRHPAHFPPGDPHGLAAICALAAALAWATPDKTSLPRQ